MSEAGIFVVLDETSAIVDKGVLTCVYDIHLVSEEGDMFGPMHRQVTVKVSGPQAYASAQSYAEKYFLRQIFKIPTGEQDADAHEKMMLPDVKPQVEALNDEESAKLRDEAIKDLKAIDHPDGFTKWKSVYGSDFKRSITKEHLQEVTKAYRDIEAKLKEEDNG
jgi:hypothetical protein